MPERTASCLAAIHENFPLPPIRLVCFQLGEQRFYDVSDGNHRCVANERSSKTHVLSDVQGTYYVNLDDKVIHHNQVWQRVDNQLVCLSVDYLDEWLINELLDLGLKRIS